MERFGMIGTTFRRGGQAQIERLTLSTDALESGAQALHEHCDFAESVYLATCNRVEIMFVGRPHVPISTYRERVANFFLETAESDSAQLLHAYGGEGAVERLFCVAAALDSMNPGEAQILGQVKAAFGRAERLGLTGAQLPAVFDAAFQTAKRVRTETVLGAGRVSMAGLAAQVIDEHLSPQSCNTLAIVGAGEISEQFGLLFQKQDLVFVNRTLARAEALAERFGGHAMGLGEFIQSPGNVDVLVTSTASTQPIFDQEFFARWALSGRPRLAVDLAVPRDIVASAPSRLGIPLVDVDALAERAQDNRRARGDELAEARALVDEALDAFQRRVLVRSAGPALRDLRGAFERTLDSSLEDLWNDLETLDASERETVERWARAMVGRLAHMPTAGLKQIAVAFGNEGTEAFWRGVREGTRGFEVEFKGPR